MILSVSPPLSLWLLLQLAGEIPDMEWWDFYIVRTVSS